MSRDPTISVVMSVYNGRRFLRQSMESILGQTFGDFEFLIVNDGSPDESRSILAEYETRDARIRVIDQENTGLTRALIRGCAEARGRYIARQDDDDWSQPDRLERSLELLQRVPEAVMASSWGRTVDAQGDLLRLIEYPEDPRAATERLWRDRIGPPGHGSVTFRREAYLRVGGYRPCFYYAQDVDLWLRMAGCGWLAYVPEPLYSYRVTAEAISGARTETQRQFGDLAYLCDAARRRGESEDPLLQQAEALRADVLCRKDAAGPSRRCQAWTNYRIGTCLSRQGNPRAGEYFRAAIRLNPFHWRSWCRLCREWLRPGRPRP